MKMGSIQTLLILSPLLISAFFGLILGLFIIRNHKEPGAQAMMALILGASLWTLCYALEILSAEVPDKLFWAKFQYFGIACVPLAWFIFSFRHFESPGWIQKFPRLWIYLSILPALTVILVWTNQYHGLIWKDVELLMVGPLRILDFLHGPVFWLFWGYSCLLLAIGTVRLIESLLGAVRLHRWQIILALFASLIPWFGNIIYVFHLGPYPNLDLTPFAFLFAGVLLSISLFRFRLVNIQPIAMKAVCEGLEDCVLVLDTENIIVDLNPACQALFDPMDGSVFGKPIGEVLPELDYWIKQSARAEELHVEITRGEEPDVKFYELRVSPLKGPKPSPIGRLVTLHEVTEHIIEQTQLKVSYAELEEVVAERTKTLKQTVERLKSALRQRLLAEKRFEEVVESAPDAILLVDKSGFIQLVNIRAEQLFGYARMELIYLNINTLIPVQRRSKSYRNLINLIQNPPDNGAIYEVSLFAQKKDGSKFPTEISIGSLRTSEGLWSAFTIRDVSERVKAEQEQQRLLAELKETHEQLRLLTFRLQDVQEFERRKISTDLHDRIGQNLTGLNLNLQIIQNQLGDGFDTVIRNRLADCSKLVEETTRQVRGVMAELHPPMLDEYGLMAALRWYGGNFSRQTGINTNVVGTEFEPRLPEKVEITLFRFVQEALLNTAKHANATEVKISAECSTETATLTVQDNGRGFDHQAEIEQQSQPHWGLLNMQQRAAFIGGWVKIESAPGSGTKVSMSIERDQPCL